MPSESRHACLCCGYRTLSIPPPGTREICPICYWEDAETDECWERSNDVTLIEAQRNYQQFGASERQWITEVRDPADHETRDPSWRSIDEIRADLKRSVLEGIEAAFMSVSRPAHFTDYRHCDECCEHDETMRSRDLRTLQLDDVGQLGWSPICFLTPEGFRYYLPAFVRLGLSPGGEAFLADLVEVYLEESYSWHFELFDEQQAIATLRLVQAVREHMSFFIPNSGVKTDKLESIERFWRGFVEQLQKNPRR